MLRMSDDPTIKEIAKFTTENEEASRVAMESFTTARSLNAWKSNGPLFHRLKSAWRTRELAAATADSRWPLAKWTFGPTIKPNRTH